MPPMRGGHQSVTRPIERESTIALLRKRQHSTQRRGRPNGWRPPITPITDNGEDGGNGITQRNGETEANEERFDGPARRSSPPVEPASPLLRSSVIPFSP